MIGEFVSLSMVAETMRSSLILPSHSSSLPRVSCISGLLGLIFNMEWVTWLCTTVKQLCPYHSLSCSHAHDDELLRLLLAGFLEKGTWAALSISLLQGASFRNLFLVLSLLPGELLSGKL